MNVREVEPVPVARVTDRTIPTDDPDRVLPIRVYEPVLEAPDAAAIVYFHGGGWVLCDLDTHDPICRRLANATDAVVIAVDYRRSPEARFPAPAEDCYAAVQWVYENADELGVDPTRIGVAGDSAGANLAAVVTLMARDRDGPRIKAQALLYPPTEHSFGTDSYREFALGGGFLTLAKMRWYWSQYLGAADGRNPYASPLLADLSSLPVALVLVAECDPLRDEGLAYGRRLVEHGVDTVITQFDGSFHGFIGLVDQLDVSRQAASCLGEWLREHL
jgi:acetyl esterase